MSRSLASRFGLVVCLTLAAALGGCQNFGDMTASIASSPEMPNDDAGIRTYADHWGKVYADRPGEKYASINYARALRAFDALQGSDRRHAGRRRQGAQGLRRAG